VFTTRLYTYEVARPLLRAFHTINPVVVHEYDVAAADAREILFNLPPGQCPSAVLFINHGDFIDQLQRDLGYTGLPIENNSMFGALMIMTPPNFNSMIFTDFGGLRGDQDVPFPPCGNNPRKPMHIPELLTKVAVPTPKQQLCLPTTMYFIRHTERFDSGPSGTQEDAVLTEAGVLHSFELRDKFVNETLPLDAVFVTRPYTYETARPLLRLTHVPVFEYAVSGVDARQILESLPPALCPDAVLFVNHGDFLDNLVRDLGYTGPMVDDRAMFGRMTILNRPIFGAMTLTDFGGLRCDQDMPFPCPNGPFP